MDNYQLGLIGYPLDHSLSPRIHGQFLKACNLQGMYHLFPIPNDHSRDKSLRELFDKIIAGEINGLNVTIPHKQTVLPFMDKLTKEAKVIQAVNTIYRDGTQLIGANTDVGGFTVDLERFLQSDLAGNALVLGAGGAARAVVYALLSLGWRVWIAARRVEQAQELSRQLNESIEEQESKKLFPIQVISLKDDDLRSVGEQYPFKLLVNTTPLGMAGYLQAIPIPEDFPLAPGVWVYDLVYNPPETALLCWAKARGAKVSNGIGMLIEQARMSFELWTGVRPIHTDELFMRLWS